jgi:hypothetical protein
MKNFENSTPVKFLNPPLEEKSLWDRIKTKLSESIVGFKQPLFNDTGPLSFCSLLVRKS